MKLFRTILLVILSSFVMVSCSTENTPVYQLTTSANPSEGGSVSPAQGDYDKGNQVTISAIPNENWVFRQWQGDYSGSQNPASITMDSDKSLVALFEMREYPLTINIEGEGTVLEKLLSAKTTHYEHGTLVELTAIPSEQWQFSGWSEDTEGQENPITVEVDKAMNITATFLRTYTLTTIMEPEEGGSITPEAGMYADGSTLQVEAIPTDNTWRFVEWEGDFTGDTNPFSLTMNGDKTITAYFGRSLHDFEIQAEGEGTVDITVISGKKEDDKFEYETVLEILAKPAEGWDFLRWELDVESEENPVQVEIDGDKTIRVVFRETFFLAENGVTIKCPNATVGEKGSVDDIEYEAVDRELLDQRITQNTDLSRVCTSLVKNMNRVFYGKGSFNQAIGNWDVGNVTDMSGMFSYANSFNQPIGDWDVSSVTNMEAMFTGAEQFNKSIGNWDVSSVTNMRTMFTGAEQFNQPIGDWDVSSVMNMDYMFYNAHAFNQDITEWCVSNISSEPFRFSEGSNLVNNKKPIWGTCPDS